MRFEPLRLVVSRWTVTRAGGDEGLACLCGAGDRPHLAVKITQSLACRCFGAKFMKSYESTKRKMREQFDYIFSA